jgi:hypothetical protein
MSEGPPVASDRCVVAVVVDQILHFSSTPKPWDEGKRKGELEMVWWEAFIKMQLGGMAGLPGLAQLSGLALAPKPTPSSTRGAEREESTL